ncbi:MAG: DUF3187 family protein [Rhodospirillaceae bacterium]|nr:DUF3187 family protein [Rhodospirillaceae bacterium]
MNAAVAAAVGRGTLAVLIAGVIAAETSVAQETVPLRTRNLSPPIAIFGLPAWEVGLGDRRGEFAVATEIANHNQLAHKGEEELVFDGETWRTTFSYRRRVGRRWSIGVELPLYRHSGGFIDDFIDAWHSFFGMPDGNRNLRAEDQLRYLYSDRGSTPFLLTEPRSGVGDMQISVGRALGGPGGWLVRAVVKRPTGDAGRLTGSGGADVSISAFKQHPGRFAGDPAGIYWGAGLLLMGEPDVFAARHEDRVLFGTFGGGWRPLPRLGLKAQLDFHSRFYDSSLDEMGKDSIQVSVGGWLAFGERRRLSLAVSEDLIVDSAPDFSVYVEFNGDF